MELSEIIPHIEALIFASERPLTSLEIVDLINNAFGFMEQQIHLDQVETALDGIREKYNTDFYPFEVLQSGGGWQFLSKPSFHPTIAQLNGSKFLKKLSNSALETLSIIAYKQPITKGEIESIRGVNSDYSVQKLLEKELIIISGRSEILPGKPLIYETSKSFMDYFGLNSSDDLPKIREVLAEQMVEPTAQQRNVEEDADFGIFKKEQEQQPLAQITAEQVEPIDHAEGDEPAAISETSPTSLSGSNENSLSPDDAPDGEEALDEAGEEEMADQELRADIAQGNEDLQSALQADLTDIRPSIHSALDKSLQSEENEQEAVERNEYLSSENNADQTNSVLETDLEDEELADEISNESEIEAEEERENEEQQRDNEATEYTIKGDDFDEDVQNDGQEDGEDDYEEEEDEEEDEVEDEVEKDDESEEEDEASEEEDDKEVEFDEDEENMKNK